MRADYNYELGMTVGKSFWISIHKIPELWGYDSRAVLGKLRMCEVPRLLVKLISQISHPEADYAANAQSQRPKTAVTEYLSRSVQRHQSRHDEILSWL